MDNKWKYWKVICHYGHVRNNKEISVARYIKTAHSSHLMDAIKIASQMPGVKKRDDILYSIAGAERIGQEEYEKGVKMEQHNLYLQKLLEFKHPP